jgi:hypothetical protein
MARITITVSDTKNRRGFTIKKVVTRLDDSPSGVSKAQIVAEKMLKAAESDDDPAQASY